VLALLPDSSALDLALASGARGLLRRDSGPDRLLAASRAVAAGLYVLDAEFSAPLRRRAPSPEPELPEALTAREREVLALGFLLCPNGWLSPRPFGGCGERPRRLASARRVGTCPRP
jgi:hypothetical protein